MTDDIADNCHDGAAGAIADEEEIAADVRACRDQVGRQRQVGSLRERRRAQGIADRTKVVELALGTGEAIAHLLEPFVGFAHVMSQVGDQRPLRPLDPMRLLCLAL